MLSNGKVVDASILVNGYTVNVISGEVTSITIGPAPVIYTITLSGVEEAVTLNKTMQLLEI